MEIAVSKGQIQVFLFGTFENFFPIIFCLQLVEFRDAELVDTEG